MKNKRPHSRPRNAQADQPRSDYGRSKHGKPEHSRPDHSRPERDKRHGKPEYAKRPPQAAAAAPVRAPFKPKPSSSPRLTGPLLWGFHAVRAAWTNPARRIIRLLVTDAGLSGFKDTLDAGTLKRPQPEVIDKLAFDRLMPPGAVHQGIAALVETLPMRDAHDLIAGLQEGEKAVLIILDQVTDPHNVGAILRSAAAFGAKGVILQDRHAPEMNGVLAKTASGAADVIPIAAETNLARIIELLQENGFFVIGLDERGMPIGELAKYDRLALVLGAEGAGIRQNVASHCDGLVCLPTQGPILSLNVSNAAAVALYAVTS